MFQRFKPPGRHAGGNGPRLILAAFGKHPGWDDHMPDIGVVTETLAGLKQKLYVTGIGGQIDAGAWERLDSAKRAEGFDHWFVWRLAHEAVLGRFWSSTDRKGRSKYPMAVCAQGDNIAPEVLLETPREILDQTRQAFQSATTADQVLAEARAAEEHLSNWLLSFPAGRLQGAIDPAQRQRFLEHPDLGPDSTGLLRVLHELSNATASVQQGSGNDQAATAYRAYHIRVPKCADSERESLQLWTSFLQTAAPGIYPLILTARVGAEYVDIILGNPATNDLFCLQASPQALPLATQIPYDIAPELHDDLRRLKARFLGSTVRADRAEDQTRPASVAGSAMATHPAASRNRFRLIGAVVAVAGVAAAVWLQPKLAPALFGKRGDSETSPATNTAAVTPTTPEPGDKQAAVQRSNEIQQAATEAQARAAKAQELEKHVAGARQARDAAEWGQASNLWAQAALLAAELNLEQERQAALRGRDESSALIAAQALLSDGKLEEAAQRLDGFTGQGATPAATELLKRVNRAKEERVWQAAVNAARSALDRQDFEGAIKQAETLLAQRPNNEQAARVKSDAQRELDRLVKLAAANEVEAKYKAALAAGQTALSQRDYARAIAQADAALALKANDPDATQLKATAQLDGAFDQATAAFNRAEYVRCLELCQSRDGAERFKRLADQARQEQARLQSLGKALQEGAYAALLEGDQPSKPPFEALRAQAVEENRVLQDARQQLEAGQYRFVETLEGQKYKAKPPFAQLLAAGRAEREVLGKLENSRRNNEPETARQLLASLSPAVRAKKPFAEAEQWAEQKREVIPPKAEAPRPKPDAPQQRAETPKKTESAPQTAAKSGATGPHANFENVLRGLEVRLGLSPEDAAVVDRDGNPVRRESNLTNAKRADAAAKIRYLREYRGDGWLTDERKARLQKLDDALRNWKD